MKPKPLLEAPKKVRLRVKPSTSDARPTRALPRLLASLLGWLCPPSAEAAETRPAAPRRHSVNVEIDWDVVAGADQYRLQIASDENFKTILVDTRVRGTAFVYPTDRSESDRTLYFKIASIDAAGTVGPFGDVESVDIDARPPDEPKKPPASVKPAKPAVADKPVEKPVVLTQEEREGRERFQLTLTLGAAHHSREFKNSESKPLTAGGQAFIPAYAGLELRRRLGRAGENPDDPGGTTLALQASAIGEKAEPTTAGVAIDSFPISLARFSLSLETSALGGQGGLGVYATTSQRFSWNGRHAQNERKIGLGIAASLATSPVSLSWTHWRVALGLVGSGAKGVDAGTALRIYGSGRVRSADHSGFFGEIELIYRMLDLETSYGGVVKLGYTL